jgi:hypothetical protein
MNRSSRFPDLLHFCAIASYTLALVTVLIGALELLPTAADLAAKRDPVLSRAAAMGAAQLPADKAGAMFPIEWRR